VLFWKKEIFSFPTLLLTYTLLRTHQSQRDKKLITFFPFFYLFFGNFCSFKGKKVFAWWSENPKKSIFLVKRKKVSQWHSRDIIRMEMNWQVFAKKNCTTVPFLLFTYLCKSITNNIFLAYHKENNKTGEP